jgi:crossover junction endodeoxyribonuclease RusA
MAASFYGVLSLLEKLSDRAPDFKIKLPLPPSVNAAYANAKKGRRKTDALTNWTSEAFSEMRGKRFNKLTGNIAVRYSLAFPDKKKRDIANYEKALSDFFVKSGVIEDDSLISLNIQQKLPYAGRFAICEIFNLD